MRNQAIGGDWIRDQGRDCLVWLHTSPRTVNLAGGGEISDDVGAYQRLLLMAAYLAPGGELDGVGEEVEQDLPRDRGDNISDDWFVTILVMRGG